MVCVADFICNRGHYYTINQLYEDTMMDSKAIVQFTADWHEIQQGTIERGGRLVVDYSIERLPRCFRTRDGEEYGDIVAYLRFHPRGEIVSGSVVSTVHDRENPTGMVIGHKPVQFESSVPSDATQAEIWFHNFSDISQRCDAWDSRFGQNYWFEIGGPPLHFPVWPVTYRSGALRRPDVVNVLKQSAEKDNVFPQSMWGGQQGSDLQTILKVEAWVKETTFGANAWIDVHIIDGQDELIHADTLTLTYAGFGSEFRYEYSGKVYQGSTATPGSVQPRPEARKVQYRLYYEVNHLVFTDGILHQFDLPEDAVT
jgi:Family of unknown function (DUF6209)